MKATTWISVFAMMACACGSASTPDAGVAVTDPRFFSVEAIALASDGQVYALGHDLIEDEYEIRIIDPISTSVSQTISLVNPHPDAHDLRLGNFGQLYFLQKAVAGAGANGVSELRAQLWCVDPTHGKEFIVDQEATGEDGSYALSPNGTMVAFDDRIEPIYAHSGLQSGTELLPHPMVFSSDSTQLLDTTRGPRLVSVVPDATRSIDASSTPVPIKGDDVLLARWRAERFEALTNKDGQVYFEDLTAHVFVPIWKDEASIYAWGDATHVFQATDGRCTDGGGIGGASCHRAAFTLYYRSLIDMSDVKAVAQADARTWSEVLQLPDAKHFVWEVDGTLFVQSL